jgi:hypothetical protein
MTNQVSQLEKRPGPVSNFYLVLATFSLFIQIPTITRVTIGSILFLLLGVPMWKNLQTSKRMKDLNNWAIYTLLVCCFLPLLTLVLDTGRRFDLNSYFTALLAVGQFYIIFLATFLSIKRLGLGFALLLLASGAALNFLQITEGDPTINPWKYYLVWPLSILGCLCAARARFPLNIGIVGALVWVSANTGSRNAILVLSIALVTSVFLTSPRLAPILSPKLINRFFISILFALLFFVPMFLSWIAQGGLGSDLQNRQLEQLQIGALGSRVEPTVGFGLMLNSPLGIGAGVRPSTADVAAGISTFTTLLRPDPVSVNYVVNKVLGLTVELHSVLFNFWVVASVVGLLFGFKILATQFMSLRYLANSKYVIAVSFLLFQSFWDMLFSPLIVNAKYCAVALAVSVFITSDAERDSV